MASSDKAGRAPAVRPSKNPTWPPGKGAIGPLAGQVTLDGHRFKRNYTFLDYLRGGLELQLMVAVDFTRSNLGQTNPQSMRPACNTVLGHLATWPELCIIRPSPAEAQRRVQRTGDSVRQRHSQPWRSDVCLRQ